MPALKAPFQHFGGKSRVAKLIWKNFGNVRNYVEAFAGPLAVLLGRPLPFDGVETVNDIDGFISNFWRAVAHDPEAVAHHADWPVNECDLHARHVWLVGRREPITARLEGDPEWFDAKVAGWWVWGLCCWIGAGWCSGNGPWQAVTGEDGTCRLVHLGNEGVGVNRQRVHLGDAGVGAGSTGLIEWMGALSERLRRVRVCCGDWTRVCGPTPTVKQGLTAVFLDPPYADTANRSPEIYSMDCDQVAHAVREWAVAQGEDPRMRICLAGYEGEHAMPDSWECVAWKAKGGYASQSRRHDNPNARRERLWFSPHCLLSEARARASMPLFFGPTGAEC